MSTISSGVGLISGLPISDLVDSLMAIQEKPLTLLQQQAAALVTRRTAWIQISAQLLSIQNLAGRLASADAFRATAAASSNESALLATADTDAALGEYTFTVRNLATRHQLISGGFATRDRTPIGAGTLTIENASGMVNSSTPLTLLNGGEGVQGGKIRITDRAGRAAEIDLRSAATIDDVLSAVNAQTTAAVRATVEGSHLVLRDQTGLSTGDLVVAEVNGGRTAADLGLLTAPVDGVITGGELVTLSDGTRLSDLNDGNGVRVLDTQKDFRVTLADGTTLDYDLSGRLNLERRDNGDGTFTDLSTPLALLNHGAGVPTGAIHVTNRAGVESDIDLSSARTIRDVTTDPQWAAAGLSVTISDSHLVVTDNSEGTGSLVIADVDGTTASELGIAGTTTGKTLTGADIYSVDTVGDVLRLINANPDNNDGNGGMKLVASISTDSPRLILTDATSGSQVLQVEALNGSRAAQDLGLLDGAGGNAVVSGRLLAGLDSVLLRSLNGGRGVATPGSIQLTDRSGGTATVDLSSAETLADVVAAINAAGTTISASVASSGLGIELRDTGSGAGPLAVADVGDSTVAADLHIAFSGAGSTISSGNLQRQYISTATLLADLRGGGVPAGKFRITNSLGASAVVDLTQGNEVTLQDVIDEIDSRGLGVTARVNDTGDGLLLEDTSGGGGRLKVSEESGTAARALGILGEAAAGHSYIDGSFEKRIVVGPGDTLNDLLTKVQSSGAPLSASVINDGTAGRPYRLNLTSSTSGRDGRLAVDTGTTGLSLATLTEARDATVFFGPPDADAPLILTSSTNTLDDAIPGVQLNLVGSSDQPVTITVTRDVDSLVTTMSGLVAAFNNAVAKIDELTKFDSDSQTRAALTDDPTVQRVRQRLMDVAVRSVGTLPVTMNRLSQAGIKLSEGSLHFDETAFRQAMEENPAAVTELFAQEVTNADGTKTVTGLAGVIKTEINHLATDEAGVIPLQEETLQSSEDLLNERISQMQTLLARRRESLLSQFYFMEQTIAKLQSQQTALNSLGTLLTSLMNYATGSNSSSSSSSSTSTSS